MRVPSKEMSVYNTPEVQAVLAWSWQKEGDSHWNVMIREQRYEMRFGFWAWTRVSKLSPAITKNLGFVLGEKGKLLEL